MPRISADTVAEHVAQQEAAVIAAASRLFAERGVNQVGLADIAAEVGLARNSLYRYFPDKGHLLAAWFRVELAPLHEQSVAIAGEDRPALDRLDAWLALHLAYLTAPEHQQMMTLADELSTLPDDVRDDIAVGHRDLYATLATIVAELVDHHEPARDVRIVTMLVAGLLRSAADQVVSGGASIDDVTAELRRFTHAAVA